MLSVLSPIASRQRALFTISSAREPKPSDDHSIASDLATSASGAVRAEAAVALRGVAAA
jgi:hypothetical protein